MFLKVATVCKISTTPKTKKGGKGKDFISFRAYCTANLENIWLRAYLDRERFTKVIQFLEPKRYIYLSGNAFVNTHRGGGGPKPGYTISIFVESLNLLSKEFHAILEAETYEEEVYPTVEEDESLELDLYEEFAKQL